MVAFFGFLSCRISYFSSSDVREIFMMGSYFIFARLSLGILVLVVRSILSLSLKSAAASFSSVNNSGSVVDLFLREPKSKN